MQALVLGTAQFGTGYGVTNAKGRLSDADVEAIMRAAHEHGIERVDTAAGYGDAQRRLRPYAVGLDVTSKAPGAEPAAIAGAIRESLADLGVAALDACLLHDWHALAPATQRAAAEALEGCRAEGLVRHVGISAYEEADLASALDTFGRLGIVQVPANALDRRLDRSPSIARLRADKARVQVRSVFLQGLLAGPSSAFLAAHPAVIAFHHACEAAGVTPLAGALAHVRALPWATEVVVGVTDVAELDEIWQAWATTVPVLAPDEVASDDHTLIDPRNW